MNNIEILEEFIERYRCSNSNVEILYKEVEALENLIEDYKELKEENLELHKEINQRIKLKLENERCVDKDFIPKSKVKEKIEELEEQLKYNLFKTHEIYTVVENKLLHEIEILQELLKEGE